jgi:hypothetical protein
MPALENGEAFKQKQPLYPPNGRKNIGTTVKLRHSRPLFEVRRFPAKNPPFGPQGPGLKAFLSEGSGVWDML